MFADKYLQKQNRGVLIERPPDNNVGISVVIPCFREPEIVATLKSLAKCTVPSCIVEVVVLINHSETAPPATKEYNHKTKIEIENWIANCKNRHVHYYAIGPLELKKKWAGAGLARKNGMDEAVRRFNLQGKTNGIIVSLDADTLVAKNYLVEIENHFKLNPADVGATISFEHQTSGLDNRQLEGIRLYEKYLGYYKNALQFTGYPYSMFTVGSAFAVTAEAYVKRGGMNRRQAGEDFYFLQNLVQIGNVGEITTTKVFPSARLSDRVPFGTGPVLQKWMAGNEDLTKTFNLQAFIDLKQFFDIKEKFFAIDEQAFQRLVEVLPSPVKKFLTENNFREEIDNLNKNCSTIATFGNRFFYLFNAFKILKFLNYAHTHFYNKVDLISQIAKLNKEL